jgi:hypothetical protein
MRGFDWPELIAILRRYPATTVPNYCYAYLRSLPNRCWPNRTDSHRLAGGSVLWDHVGGVQGARVYIYVGVNLHHRDRSVARLPASSRLM